MASYIITVTTVTPLEHGYEYRLFDAVRTTHTADGITNTAGLGAAMTRAATEHYDANPETTPAVMVIAEPARGSRHVARGRQMSPMPYHAATLAAESAKHKRILASLAPSLPGVADE